VVEQARFFLCQHHDPAGPIGKAFEHWKDRLFSLRTLAEVYLGAARARCRAPIVTLNYTNCTGTSDRALRSPFHKWVA
jgi:hypothetical protein